VCEGWRIKKNREKMAGSISMVVDNLLMNCTGEFL
jgi:hypothetical protein